MIAYPLLLSVITGLIAGGFAETVTGYTTANAELAGRAFAPYALGAMLAAWVVQLMANLPHAPAPKAVPMLPAEQTVRVNVLAEDGKQGEYMTFDTDAAKLREFAQGIVAGKSLAVREWTGPGGLFGDSEYTQLRSKLIERRLAQWVNANDPKSGCVLTPMGKAVMGGLARPPLSPRVVREQ